MYELIISEKPNAAKRIAAALADGKPIKENINGVPYYKVTHGKKDIIIASTVGHLYGLAQKEGKKWTFPIFEITWKPIAEVSKGTHFSKKYLDVIKKLCKEASSFTIATDYDIEGEVIGLNVLRYGCKQKDASRMKFSTLTKLLRGTLWKAPTVLLSMSTPNCPECLLNNSFLGIRTLRLR